MDNFRECGAMYIKFDQQNNPEYGFVVDDTVLTKFYPLCDREIKKISLPNLPVKYATLNQGMQQNLAAHQKFRSEHKESRPTNYYYNLVAYAKGGVKIASGCFAGIKQMQIEAPVNSSVMLDNGCFDKGSQIELLLPPAMDLKQVRRMFDTGYDYEREDWTIIAHQNFNINLDVPFCDSYSTTNYDYRPSRYQITVKHLPAEKLQTCLIGPRQTAKGLEPENKSL